MSTGSCSGSVALVTNPEELAKLVIQFANECYKNDEFQSKMRLSDLFLSPDKRPGVTLVLGEHENDPVRFSDPFLKLWAEYATNSEMLAPGSIKQYFPNHDLKQLIELAKKHPDYSMEFTSTTDSEGNTKSSIKAVPINNQSGLLEPTVVVNDDAADETVSKDDKTLPEGTPPYDDFLSPEDSVQTTSPEDASDSTERRSKHPTEILQGKKYRNDVDADELSEIVDVLHLFQTSGMNKEIAEKLAALSNTVSKHKAQLAPKLVEQLKTAYEQATKFTQDTKYIETGAGDILDDPRVKDLIKTIEDVVPELQKAAAYDKVVPLVKELLLHVKKLERKVQIYDPFVKEISDILPEIKRIQRSQKHAGDVCKSDPDEIADLKHDLKAVRTENAKLKKTLESHRRSIDSAHKLIQPSMDLVKENKNHANKVKQVSAENRALKTKLHEIEVRLPKLLDKVKTLSGSPAVKRTTTGLNDDLAGFVKNVLGENKRDALYSRIAGGDRVLKQLFDRVEEKYFANDGGSK